MIDLGAKVALAGMDPRYVFETGDLLTLMYLDKVADRVLEFLDIQQDNLAVKIANNVGKLFDG